MALVGPLRAGLVAFVCPVVALITTRLRALRALADALLLAVQALALPTVRPRATFDVAAVDPLGTVGHRLIVVASLRGAYSSPLQKATVEATESGARNGKANEFSRKSPNQECSQEFTGKQ